MRKPVPIIKGAEPYFHIGGKTGVLFLHGFTSTPQEGREFGKHMHSKGFSFYAPLLPGHGTSPECALLVKWDDWIRAAHDAVSVMEHHCKKIYVVGNSFGGNLAFFLANHPKVKGIVSMGTVMYFRNHRMRGTVFHILNRFKLFQKKRYRPGVDEVIKNRIAYETMPLMALAHVLKVIKESKKQLPFVKIPCLIMHSKTDYIAHIGSAEYIQANIASKEKKIVYVADSYHNLLIDKHKQFVYKEIEEFMK